jgi:B-cell receptor-associated protein 31
VTDLKTPQAEANAHMKQFRSQRNFYIAGFALFLWLYVNEKIFLVFLNEISFSSVIKRLISLLSAVAREMSDSAAARKQAEGAHLHLKNLASNDPAVRIFFV